MRINRLLTPYDIERLTLAISYIEKNYKDAISADQLAIEVNIDIRRLQFGIKQLTGLTVHNYLLSIRVSRAATDLKNFSSPIKSIAYKHGFCSSSHFGTEFKKRMGVTPKEYRYQEVMEANYV